MEERVFTRRKVAVRLSAGSSEHPATQLFVPGDVVRMTPDRSPNPAGDVRSCCVFEAGGSKFILPSGEFFAVTKPLENTDLASSG